MLSFFNSDGFNRHANGGGQLPPPSNFLPPPRIFCPYSYEAATDANPRGGEGGGGAVGDRPPLTLMLKKVHGKNT